MTIRLRDIQPDEEVPVVLLHSGLEAANSYMNNDTGFPAPQNIQATLQDDFGNVVVLYVADGQSQILIVQSIDLEFEPQQESANSDLITQIDKLGTRLLDHGEPSCQVCGAIADWEECDKPGHEVECYILECRDGCGHKLYDCEDVISK